MEDRSPQFTNTQGVQVGEGNVQHNTFNFPGVPAPAVPLVAGNVPQAPPGFQSRDELMAQLRAAGPGISVVRAVTGLRGVGKTHLAAAYARECIDAGWRLVAWVNAEDTLALLNGLAVVADRLGLSRPGTGLTRLGADVRNRLEADGDRCLLVFDNVTDAAAVRPYLPAAGQCQLVLTSTLTDVESLGASMPVDVFTRDESLAFLAEGTGLSDGDGAEALAGELGDLPLALAQAAAVIRSRRISYPEYLRRLRQYPVQPHLPADKAGQYPHGTAEAILLSIDAVAADDPGRRCVGLLTVVALLSPDGVPRRVLVGSEEDEGALGLLAAASLLTFGDTTVVAHRLVMRAVRERAARDGTLYSVAVIATGLLARAAGMVTPSWHHQAAARDLVRQVISLSEHVRRYTSEGTGPLAESLLASRLWAVGCLNELADSEAEAVALGETVWRDAIAMHGEDHLATLSAGDALGSAYCAVGRLDEGLALQERSLAGCERLLGAEHPDTLAARHNLADVCRTAGRLDEAIALFERCLADNERLLGENDQATLAARGSLAVAYLHAGREADGIALHERTLAARERLLGEGHPDTLAARHNLAVAYRAAGRLGEAISLYQRVAVALERLLGLEHRLTLHARASLAEAREQAARAGEGDGERPPA